MKNYTCFCILLGIIIQNAVAIREMYMDEQCGEEIDLKDYDSMRLRLPRYSQYKQMNCILRVKTDSNSRIMLYFKSFRISCSDDNLDVIDGDSGKSSYVSGLRDTQCGWSISNTGSVFETSGNYLYLRFHTQRDSWLQSAFDMVLTSFHTGSCEDSNEFTCSNDRCISDSLTCNGYNPCGDYSDCAWVLAVGAIVGIVIGSVALVVTVVTVVVIICRRRRIAYNGRTVGQPMGVVTTTTAGYGHPYPQQYPSQITTAYPVGQQYPDKQCPQY